MSQSHHQPTDSEVLKIMKALSDSGQLKDIDALSEADARSRIAAELSRQGLGHIHPDTVICSRAHYCFIIKKD